MKQTRNILAVLALVLAVSLPASAESYRIVASSIQGKVEKATKKGGDKWAAVKNHEKLAVGDKVRTGADSSVILTFDGGNVLAVSPMSQITIAKLARNGKAKTTQIDVDSGRVMGSARKLKNADSSFMIKTPQGTAAVRGSEVAATVSGAGTLFQVLEGKFHVTVGNDTGDLEAGFQMDILASMTDVPEPAKIDPAVLQTLRKEMDAAKTAGEQADALGGAEDNAVETVIESMQMLDRANQGSCRVWCSYWQDGQCAYTYEICEW